MFRRLLGFPERSEMPPLVDGEVISLSRFLTRTVALAIYLLIVSLLLFFVFLVLNQDRFFLGGAVICAFCAIGPLGMVLTLIVFKPRLVLGRDRIQSASRLRDVDWEVKYEDIAEMKMLVKNRARFIGIKFTENASLHPLWQCQALKKSRQNTKKRLGYDLCLNCGKMLESPEAVFEALLRCFHRFEDDKQLKLRSAHLKLTISEICD